MLLALQHVPCRDKICSQTSCRVTLIIISTGKVRGRILLAKACWNITTLFNKVDAVHICLEMPMLCCSNGAGMDEFGVSFDADEPLALDDDEFDSDAAVGPYQPGTPTNLA